MSDDDLDIPDFLRRYPGERQAAWKVTVPASEPAPAHPWHLPKHMDAACWAMVAEAAAAKERKKQEGLAALAAWKKANKR